MSDLDPRELVITRVFDAPRELVFKAWTDPVHATHWFGPRSHPAALVEMDARVGGAWRSCLRAADGTGDLWMGGVCREVVAPERLVFTFAWDDEGGERGPETLVTVTFAAQGERTLMTFRQGLFPDAAETEGHHEGWSSALDRFDEYLAQGGVSC